MNIETNKTETKGKWFVGWRYCFWYCFKMCYCYNLQAPRIRMIRLQSENISDIRYIQNSNKKWTWHFLFYRDLRWNKWIKIKYRIKNWKIKSIVAHTTLLIYILMNTVPELYNLSVCMLGCLILKWHQLNYCQMFKNKCNLVCSTRFVEMEMNAICDECCSELLHFFTNAPSE